CSHSGRSACGRKRRSQRELPPKFHKRWRGMWRKRPTHSSTVFCGEALEVRGRLSSGARERAHANEPRGHRGRGRAVRAGWTLPQRGARPRVAPAASRPVRAARRPLRRRAGSDDDHLRYRRGEPRRQPRPGRRAPGTRLPGAARRAPRRARLGRVARRAAPACRRARPAVAPVSRYQWVPSWAELPPAPRGWMHSGIALLDGEIVVAHAGEPTLLWYGEGGDLRRSVPVPGLLELHGFEVVPDGLWIADIGSKRRPRGAEFETRRGDGRVVLVDRDGAIRFSCPHCGAVDRRRGDPELYVADRANGRLQVYDLEGRFRRVAGAGVLVTPADLALVREQ